MFVAQWKNYRWVNFYDENGGTRYFASAEEAREFLKTRHVSRPVEARICEYLGGRSYKEVDGPKPLHHYR